MQANISARRYCFTATWFWAVLLVPLVLAALLAAPHGLAHGHGAQQHGFAGARSHMQGRQGIAPHAPSALSGGRQGIAPHAPSALSGRAAGNPGHFQGHGNFGRFPHQHHVAQPGFGHDLHRHDLHRHHFRQHGFVGVPVPLFIYPDPYPYPAPLASTQPAPAEQQWWYYCPDPPGYYPQVQQCLGQWLAVPATTY
ncbi:MAG: hypothetical protein JWP36_1845 [Paucimonas sp.]|nr:hypothetical protein [Paucimonas sp.]